MWDLVRGLKEKKKVLEGLYFYLCTYSNFNQAFSKD